MPPVVLIDALDAALSGRFEAADAALGQLLDSTPASVSRRRALSALVEGVAGRHRAAVRLATRALDGAPDATTATLALAISCFVHSFAPRAEIAGRAPKLFEELWERRDTVLALRGDDGAVAGYAAIEAAMAVGRLVDAQALAEHYLALTWFSPGSPSRARSSSRADWSRRTKRHGRGNRRTGAPARGGDERLYRRPTRPAG